VCTSLMGHRLYHLTHLALSKEYVAQFCCRRVYQTLAAFDAMRAVNMFQTERSVVFNEPVSCQDCIWPVADERITSVMHWWNDTGREKAKYYGKKRHSFTSLSTTGPASTDVGSNRGTNCLKHGTAQLCNCE